MIYVLFLGLDAGLSGVKRKKRKENGLVENEKLERMGRKEIGEWEG